MPVNDPDRELLYGLLAVQMGLVERNALVEGMKDCFDGSKESLGEELLRRGALSQERKDLIDAFFDQHLAAHGHDAARSLATLSTIGSLGEELKTIGVPALNVSLAHLDAAATRMPSAGVPLASQPHDRASDAMRFRVLRTHAKGGIGQVSVVIDDELSREVALKELQPATPTMPRAGTVCPGSRSHGRLGASRRGAGVWSGALCGRSPVLRHEVCPRRQFAGCHGTISSRERWQ